MIHSSCGKFLMIFVVGTEFIPSYYFGMGLNEVINDYMEVIELSKNCNYYL